MCLSVPMPVLFLQDIVFDVLACEYSRALEQICMYVCMCVCRSVLGGMFLSLCASRDAIRKA
jgi:hypothetical protein